MRTHTYWVDAALPARTQEVIRTTVMPAVETWTHHEWAESEEQTEALQWYEGDAYFGTWCGDKDDWAGCAVLGEDIIGLRRYATGPEGEQVIIPARVMYEIGLHEALHALYAAEHTQSGIMCVEDGPKKQVSRGLRRGGFLHSPALVLAAPSAPHTGGGVHALRQPAPP